MLTVRFPDGTAVQYNRANYLHYNNGTVWTLMTKEGGDWVASISPASGCIVEADLPCRVYNSLANVEQLRLLMENMRSLPYAELRVLVELKRALAKFNATTREWKE